MWYFTIRLALIAFITIAGLVCVNVGTFGPMFTGHILLAVSVIWIIIELILAVEQIVNSHDREASLNKIVNHPNKHTAETVQWARLELDRIHYARIHEMDIDDNDPNEHDPY